MQLGHANLTQAERVLRTQGGVCLCCCKPGNFLAHCPVQPKDLVLGHPWLVRHNPHIVWSAGRIIVCLQYALSPVDSSHSVATEPPDLSNVPPQYLDLWEVFCKARALSLPPHCSYDCAIDLLPGAPLRSGRLYNLSRPERGVMKKSI